MADFVQTVGGAVQLLPAYTLAQIQATSPPVPSTAFAYDNQTWYRNNADGSGWQAVAGAPGPAPQQTTVQVIAPFGGASGGGGGAVNFASTGSAATASAVANVSSATSAWGKGRARIDTPLNNYLGFNNWTLICADDNTANMKVEVFCSFGGPSSTGFNIGVQVFSQGSCVMSIPVVTSPTLAAGSSGQIPAGQDFQYAWFWTAANIGIALYDGLGNKINAFVRNGSWGTLGAYGFVRVNHAPIVHGSGGTLAALHDGHAIYSGAPPDTTFTSNLFTSRPGNTDSNIVYLSYMNDATQGTSPAIISAQVGSPGLTAAGTWNYTTDATSGAWGGTTVVVTELAGSFVVAQGGTLQLTASTFVQGSTTPLTGRTYTWATSAGSITAAGVLTAPALHQKNITVTATDTGVVGALTGTAIASFATLSAAATAASVFWTTSVNINYVNAPYTTNEAAAWTELANAAVSTTSGGMAVEEVVFQERYLLTNLTWVTNTPTLTFGYASADTQITKAAGGSQKSQMRNYMFTGNPTNNGGPGGSLIASSLFASTPGNATAVGNLLDAYVSQTIAHWIANHGTAASGIGVADYVVNEFIQPWYTSTNGFAPNLWYKYLGSGWILRWLQDVHTADSTAHCSFVFNNIETAGSSAQQNFVLAMLQGISGQSGIPPLAVLVEAHAGGGGYYYTAADMASLLSFNQKVIALGFKVGVAEYDNTDTLAQNQGSSGYIQRDQQNVSNLSMLIQAYGPVWSNVYSFGVWGGISDQLSWLNNPPNPGTPYTRPDDSAAIAAGTQTGTTQRPCLLDVNGLRKGGAGSSQDAYGSLMSILSVQAA